MHSDTAGDVFNAPESVLVLAVHEKAKRLKLVPLRPVGLPEMCRLESVDERRFDSCLGAGERSSNMRV